MSAGTYTKETISARTRTADSLPLTILKTLGSLKITVSMFALAIAIVFFGTLAQDEMDLAQVKRTYFTCWIAQVPVDVLFPQTLFPHESPVLGGLKIPFPGGALIGLVLLINLIAAKTTRFSISGKGKALWIGLAICLVGTGLIIAVISSGHTTDGLQGKPPLSYDALWSLLKGGCILLTIVLVGYAIVAKLPKLARIMVVAAAVISLLLSVLLLSGGESVRLDDPGLRIVWQLLQATIASSVLLAGLWLMFGKRGGNVLIHIGVGLLMVGQFVFGDRQLEQRFGLAEGSSTNLAVIEDEIEIVLIDKSNPEEDTVYAIPESRLRLMERRGEQLVNDAELPAQIKIVDFMRNSSLVQLDDETENPATTGIGLRAAAIEETPLGAAMMDGRNLSSAYVQILDKDSGEAIDTVLLSQELNDIAQLTAAMQPDAYEQVTIDGKPFELAIRFRQNLKPYDITLQDVERINYSGTDTPRDYSSRIVITDRETGESQEGKTWMNNPIRYKGETFYQSRYNKIPTPDGQVVETTGLQVVRNAGWVIPYVSCMMVFVGMFAHFGITFLNFSSRVARGSIPTAGSIAQQPISRANRILVAVAALGFCGLITAYFAKSPSYGRDEINWTEISQLPVQHEGRIKPFDTVARNVLQIISEPLFGSVPYVKDAAGEKRSPSEWLLGTIAEADWVRDARVYRIYAQEVRDLFDLEPRKGYRYSYAELEPNLEKFRAEIAPLRTKDPDKFDFREQKLAKMHRQLNLVDLLSISYRDPPLLDPDSAQTAEERTALVNRLIQVAEVMQQLENGGPPSMIPPPGEATRENVIDARWQAKGPATFNVLLEKLGVASVETSPALMQLDSLLAAVKEGNEAEINREVREYKKVLAGLPLAATKIPKAETESWLNQYNPIFQGVALYILALLVGFAGFLFRSDSMRRGTFWLLVGIFLIHTVALAARIYISGRAPVINLYSSAVFIGWACVLLGLVLEAIYPIGISNLVSAIIGACTLSVARALDTQDTLHVLQAVLDTQFWLSVHVLTVTAGYAVTFLAGFIAIAALVHRMITSYDAYSPQNRPKEHVNFQQIFYRMTYGVLCFAIFFSFIGTVLGGLWADDSWGRFWGWDPKENGAMMIVLWNALILHARWDKQVGMRGFAVLAVLGNIMTAWSWFGTNQLGIGLHSYGFTNGALYTLIGFVAVNLVFVVVALTVTKALAAGGKRAENV